MRLIELIPYNSEWPKRFQQVRDILNQCLGDLALRIDHIGSTSVPGLGAKDRIDIQITVHDLSQNTQDKIDRAMLGAGFPSSQRFKDHRPENNSESDEMWEKLFISGIHSGLSFQSNIHIRVEGRSNQIYPLLFRDYLRSNIEAAKNYQKIKEILAKKFPHDIDSYLEIKDPVCDLIMISAKKWAESTNWKPSEGQVI